MIASSFAGALWSTQGIAAADGGSPEEAAKALGKTLSKWDGGPRDNNPADCGKHLKALTDANAPASITFTQEQDVPGIKAGTHPWTDARAACEELVRADRERRVIKFAMEANNAKVELARTDGVNPSAGMFTGCITAYEEAIQAGIPPTERITERDFDSPMQEIRDKFCTAGLAKVKGDKAAYQAPFRKVLKNDKLKLWLEEEKYIDLPGGKETPELLSAAKVWFQHRPEERVCANGKQLHTLRRWQFDTKQNMVSNTIRDFCGQPPASAWR